MLVLMTVAAIGVAWPAAVPPVGARSPCLSTVTARPRALAQTGGGGSQGMPSGSRIDPGEADLSAGAPSPAESPPSPSLFPSQSPPSPSLFPSPSPSPSPFLSPPPPTPVAPATSPAPVSAAPGSGDLVIPRGRIAVVPHFAYRLGQAGSAISPAAGFGLAGTMELDYWRAGLLAAALGIDFGYDRFATAEQGTVVVDGVERTFGATRLISETSFVLVHTAAVQAGRARPYLSVGGGLGLGYFDSVAAAWQPGTARATHLLGRVSVGVDVALVLGWAAVVRADYTAVRGDSSLYTADGRTVPLFGDLFGLGAGIAYRF